MFFMTPNQEQVKKTITTAMGSYQRIRFREKYSKKGFFGPRVSNLGLCIDGILGASQKMFAGMKFLVQIWRQKCPGKCGVIRNKAQTKNVQKRRGARGHFHEIGRPTAKTNF